MQTDGKAAGKVPWHNALALGLECRRDQWPWRGQAVSDAVQLLLGEIELGEGQSCLVWRSQEDRQH